MKNDFFVARYFLGANSPTGFVSRFDYLYQPEQDWFAYILKGGPGTGKSTLMKHIAKYAIDQNVETELIYCSSDPYSLDAVIFPDYKSCVVDGTAPHTLDPKYPGVSDTIINLGQCWDPICIIEMKEEIITLTKRNSSYHQRSSRYLAACGALDRDSNKMVQPSIQTEKLLNYTQNLSKKLFGASKEQKGMETVRFLSGITPDGLVVFEDTLSILCDNIYIIDDEYGSASSILLAQLRDHALSSGFNTITCYCPMDPSQKIEFLLIPKLKIAFAVSNSWHPLSGIEAFKRIHAKRFSDSEMLSSRRQRLGFNRRMERELLNEAVSNLKKAKEVHDDLEKLYSACMNYHLVDQITNHLINTIFG